MADYLLQGFLLGLAYLAPIGMQNLYVMNTAAQGNWRRTVLVALATIFFDISLAVSCFFGVGLLLDAFPAVRRGVMLAGSVAVLYIGVSLIRAASRRADGQAPSGGPGGPGIGNVSPARLIASCFAVTWLNPQAIIDASLLMGGYRASLPPGASTYFILGVCLASASWFSGISVLVAALRARFNPVVIRWINIVCGAALIVYGIRLALETLWL